MSPANESQLVQRAVAGDRGALGALLERHQERLFNIVLRMLGQYEDAADVTQEALLKVVQHIGDYRGRSSLGTWMVRIAMNLAISHLRRDRSHATVSIESSSPTEAHLSLRLALGDSRELDPAVSVQKDEEAREVLASLACLDVEQKAALTLRDIDGMSYSDMADVLGVPVGTVKSRLFRARLALRQELAAKSADPSACGTQGGAVAPAALAKPLSQRTTP